MKTLVTRLFLVRHGATQLTAENRFSGAVGVDLSDEGRTQVRYLAARLAEEKIGAIYCSPLSRTVETANILSLPHGLAPIQRDGLLGRQWNSAFCDSGKPPAEHSSCRRSFSTQVTSFTGCTRVRWVGSRSCRSFFPTRSLSETGSWLMDSYRPRGSTRTSPTSHSSL